MHKSDLIEALAERTGLSKKQVESFFEAFQVFVTEKLKAKEEITLTGFGTFSAKTRGARMGVNPQNPTQKIQIPEVVVPKFKAGKALKDALKGK